MYFRKFMLVLTVLSVIFSVGCSRLLENNTKKVVNMGSINNNIYKNDFFGLEFTIPNDWTIASEEEKEKISNSGNEMVAGEDKELKEKLDLAKVKTLNLVYAFRHPFNYSEGFNHNFMCIGENLSIMGLLVKNGEDYLKEAKKIMGSTDMPYVFDEITKVEIGGKSFYMMGAKIELENMTIQQKNYSTVINGYALNFIITYTNEEQLKELDGILETIKFD